MPHGPSSCHGTLPHRHFSAELHTHSHVPYTVAVIFWAQASGRAIFGGIPMKAQIRWVSMFMLCAMAALAFAGCNTVHGMGTDIKKGGEKIEDVAK